MTPERLSSSPFQILLSADLPCFEKEEKKIAGQQVNLRSCLEGEDKGKKKVMPFKLS